MQPLTVPADDVIDAWPLCPACQVARVAVCKVCGAAKDYFPPAYQLAGEDHELRFCASCDDVAELQYYRRCPECGHDFGAGLEPKEPPPDDHENRARVWLLLFVLLGGAGLMGAYFYSLFRR